ncbi:hypothetical protein MMC29_004711 [Sticta canariensis]|nr:hypothetical protein [Sticta canariensis]
MHQGGDRVQCLGACLSSLPQEASSVRQDLAGAAGLTEGQDNRADCSPRAAEPDGNYINIIDHPKIPQYLRSVVREYEANAKQGQSTWRWDDDSFLLQEYKLGLSQELPLLTCYGTLISGYSCGRHFAAKTPHCLQMAALYQFNLHCAVQRYMLGLKAALEAFEDVDTSASGQSRRWAEVRAAIVMQRQLFRALGNQKLESVVRLIHNIAAYNQQQPLERVMEFHKDLLVRRMSFITITNGVRSQQHCQAQHSMALSVSDLSAQPSKMLQK